MTYLAKQLINCSLYIALIGFSISSSGQDVCSNAVDLGTLFCDSVLADVVGSSLNPDPEAIGCLVGQPAGWLEFEVDASVPEFEIFGDNLELFTGSCGNLVFEDEICFSSSLFVTVTPGVTYYILLEENGICEILSPFVDTPNMECTDAELITSNSFVVDLGCTTPGTGPLCSGEASLWYELDLNVNGALFITVQVGQAALYEDDCSTPIAAIDNFCDVEVPFDCLQGGTYFLEIIGDIGDIIDVDITEIPPIENDNCDDAIPLNGFPETCFGGFEMEPNLTTEDAVCIDPEGSSSCIERGVWYSFETDATWPFFTISGTEYELFEGDCSNLNSLVSCDDNFQVDLAGPQEFLILVAPDGFFIIETPPPPLNTTCEVQNPELPTNEPTFICCGEEHWYTIPPISDAFTLNISELIQADLTVGIFDANCNGELFLGTFDDQPFTFAHCGQPFQIFFQTQTCGQYEFDLELLTAEEPFANTCTDITDTSFPETGEDEICVSSDNSFACGTTCNGVNTVWFEVIVDENADMLFIETSGNSGFQPEINVYVEDCDNLLLTCLEDEAVSFPVMPEENYFIEVGSIGTPGEFDICFSTTAEETSPACPFDDSTDLILVDSLSGNFANTGGVLQDLVEYNFTGCDSICVSMAVSTNGSSWIGSGNLNWSGECVSGSEVCSGDVEDASSVACAGCWDFITAEVVMNDSIYFMDLLGDAATDSLETIWLTGKVGTPSLSVNPGLINIQAQVSTPNASLSYSGLTVICYTGPLVDADNDGVFSDMDCDDTNPNLFPGNVESCDGVDNDCDGLVDEGLMVSNFYLDADSDGFGDAAQLLTSCVPISGYVTNNTDCNDADANINPNAVEIINNDIDENCDGVVEVIDVDGDGVNSSLDCDDNDPNNFPGNAESCDGRDNNCNQQADENLSFQTFFVDVDGDGFGNNAQSLSDCVQPLGYVLNNTDCDDNNPNINPSATEVPNNTIDEDCDGIAQVIDNDNDGANSSIDCDDNNAEIFPGNVETCDGLDNNCNQQTDEGLTLVTYFLDMDGDGFGDMAVTLSACLQPTGYVLNNTDCDDTNAVVNPGATEIINNNIDENCDGLIEVIDNDGDGSNSSVDCDDNNSNIFPGNMESCDGVDNNCNQMVDEGLTFLNYYRDNDNDGFGDNSMLLSACSAPTGFVLNNTDCDDTNASIFPGNSESCDGIDNNCNQEIDEGVVFVDFFLDMDGDGFGDPSVSLNDCVQPPGYVSIGTDCDDTDSTINPSAVEVPNNQIDENCDGLIEVIDNDGDGVNSDDDCDDDNATVFPGNTESCDGLDNNCNQEVDEGLAFVDYFIDADGDGFGSFGDILSACTPPAGYIDNDLDCDDTDPSINPDAVEILNNGIDENCDGMDMTSSVDNPLTGINIFPNPVNEILFVDTELNIEYEIFSYQGLSLKQAKLVNRRINTEFLQPGIYFLQLVDSRSKAKLSMKVIKVD